MKNPDHRSTPAFSAFNCGKPGFCGGFAQSLAEDNVCRFKRDDWPSPVEGRANPLLAGRHVLDAQRPLHILLPEWLLSAILLEGLGGLLTSRDNPQGLDLKRSERIQIVRQAVVTQVAFKKIDYVNLCC